MLGKGEDKAGKWLPQAAFEGNRGAKIRMRFSRLSPQDSSFWCLSSAAGLSHEALPLLVHLVSQSRLVVMISHFKALCWSWTLLGWSLPRAEPGCPTRGSSWQCLSWQVSTSTSALTMPLCKEREKMRFRCVQPFGKSQQPECKPSCFTTGAVTSFLLKVKEEFFLLSFSC